MSKDISSVLPDDWTIPKPSFLDDLSQALREVITEGSWVFGMIDDLENQTKNRTNLLIEEGVECLPIIAWKVAEILADPMGPIERSLHSSTEKMEQGSENPCYNLVLRFIEAKKTFCGARLYVDPSQRIPSIKDWKVSIQLYFLSHRFLDKNFQLVKEGENFVNIFPLFELWKTALTNKNFLVFPTEEEAIKDCSPIELPKQGNWWWGSTEQTINDLSKSSNKSLRQKILYISKSRRHYALGWMGTLGWSEEWINTFLAREPTENKLLDDRNGDREMEQALYTFLRAKRSDFTAQMARAWKQKYPNAGRYWIEGSANPEHITRLELLFIHASLGHSSLLDELPTIMWLMIARYAKRIPSKHYTRWIWWLCRGHHSEEAIWLVDEFARLGGRVDETERTSSGYMTALDIALHRHVDTLPILYGGEKIEACKFHPHDQTECRETDEYPFNNYTPRTVMENPDVHPDLFSAEDAKKISTLEQIAQRNRAMDNTEILVVNLLNHGANPNALIAFKSFAGALGDTPPNDTSTTRLVRQMCMDRDGSRWSMAQISIWITSWIRGGWTVQVGDDGPAGKVTQKAFADILSVLIESHNGTSEYLTGQRNFGMVIQGTPGQKMALMNILTQDRGLWWVTFVPSSTPLFSTNRLVGRYFNRLAEEDRKNQDPNEAKKTKPDGHDFQYTGRIGPATPWEAMVEDWMDAQPLERLTQDILQVWRWKSGWAAWDNETATLDKVLRLDITANGGREIQENLAFRKICRQRLRDGVVEKPIREANTSWTLYTPKDFEELTKASARYPDHEGLKGWTATLEKRGGKNGGRRTLAKSQAAGPALLILRENFPHFSDLINRIDNHLALANVGTGVFSLPPILLAGPPGTGKTFFFSELAKAVKIPYHILNMESISGGFAITGLDTSWGNSAAGCVFESLADSTVVNPIFLLDEIDKTTNSNFPVAATLLPLLEPHSASTFRDRCVPLQMDIRPVIWVATANDLSKVSEPIKSRFEIIHVRQPDESARRAMTRAIYKALRASNNWGPFFDAQAPEDVVCHIAHSADSARDLRKTLTTTFAAAARANRRTMLVMDVPRGNERAQVEAWDEPLELMEMNS